MHVTRRRQIGQDVEVVERVVVLSLRGLTLADNGEVVGSITGDHD